MGAVNGLGIAAELIKIEAVGAGVAENSVQKDPDALCPGVGAEPGKVLIAAQKGIDGEIIRRVVAVVAGGGKNGVEVKAGNAQRAEVGELFPDAPERAAPEGPGAYRAVLGPGIKGRSIPIRDQEAAAAPARLRLAGLRGGTRLYRKLWGEH